MISYYEGEGDKKMLPEIYYLAGSTYFDLHDSPQALDYYHKVLDNITADDNLRLWGITHAQIGYVMLYQGNYAAAIDHYKISYRVDSLRNDVEGMIFDLRDLGLTYSSTEKLDSAIFYSHKALQLALKKKCLRWLLLQGQVWRIFIWKLIIKMWILQVNTFCRCLVISDPKIGVEYIVWL